MKKLSSVNILGGLTVDQATTLSGTVSIGGIGTGAYTSVLVRNGSNQLLHRSYNDFVSDITTSINLSNYVPISRTLTINGTTYDLSANRSWTIANNYISNVALANNALTFTGVGAGFNGTISLDPVLDEVRTVYERVKNTSGATIQKGTPLAVVPGQTSGNLSDVIPADAADPAKMPAVYIANETMLNGAEGQAILFGFLHGVDTSLYPSGTTVYVAAGGGWTSTKPVHPNKVQNLGVITKQHASNGSGVVTGVGRANDLPNLTAGKIWVGSPTYPIESTTVHVDEANGRVGIGATAPLRKLHVAGGDGFAVNASTSQYYGVYIPALGEGANPEIQIGDWHNAGARLQWNSSTRALSIDTQYSTGAGTFNITGNDFASTFFTVASSGNVGIGTASPSSALDVRGVIESSTGTIRTVLSYTGSGGVTGTLTNHPYILYANNAERMRIDASGNVGIGTTAPEEKLHVAGSTFISYSGTNANYFGQGNALGYGRIRPFNNSGLLSFDTNYTAGGGYDFAYNGSSVVRITSSGNVGIGTTSPERKLHVFAGESGGAASNTQSTLVLENSTNTYLQFLTPATSQSGILFGDTDNDRGALTYSHSSDTMSFTVAASTKMTILSSGNVGIGETSIDARLHITSAGAVVNQKFESSGVAAWRIGIPNGQTYFAFDNTTDALTSPKVAIASSGNVGIGTTSPAHTLDVNGELRVGTVVPQTSADFSVRRNGANIEFGHGNRTSGYYGTIGVQGNNGMPYIAFSADCESSVNTFTTRGFKGNVIHTDSAGNFMFSQLTTANSTGQSLTERMRILANGNVGIGTTAPSEKLQVAGNAVVTTTTFGLATDAVRLENATGDNRSVGQFIGDPSVYNAVGAYGTNTVNGSIAGIKFNWYSQNWMISATRSGSIDIYGLVISQNSTERLVIGNTGNVGIGTTSPSEKLDVVGNLRLFSGGYPYIDLGISTSNYWRIINDNPNDTFVIGKNGASNFILNPVGAATFSSSVTAGGVITATGGTSTDWNTAFSWGNHAGLYLPITGGTVGGPVTINGSLVVNGTITENSSAKLKENVETSEGNLEKVVNLRPVSYNKIGSQNTELGLIAEEVANVYPEFVQYDENGEPVGVHYSRLTAALIGAVKELNEQLQELKKNNG